MDFDKRGGENKRGGWKTKMDFDKRGGRILFCGGWNFSKLVSLESTFIREVTVRLFFGSNENKKNALNRASWSIKFAKLVPLKNPGVHHCRFDTPYITYS